MASLQRRDDVDRLCVGLGDGLAVVLAEAVEGVAALHDDAGRRHVADLDGVVLGGADRLGEVEADLLAVDVERGDELDVADVVVAELHVHQAGDGAGRVGVLVVLDALDERRGAVADADDGDANRTHFLLLVVGGRVRSDVVVVVVCSLLDELVEPAHLALGALEPVLLQLRGCSRRGARGCGSATRAARRPAPRAASGGPRGCAGGPGLGAAEERQVGGEALVLPRLGAGLCWPRSANCSLPSAVRRRRRGPGGPTAAGRRSRSPG